MGKPGILAVILALLLGAFVFWRMNDQAVVSPNQGNPISSFEECVEAGNPVMESYPPQCRTEDGQTFAQDIGNAQEMSDTIVVENPKPVSIVSNPLKVKGKARGVWFFEASFPAKILDEKGNTLAHVPIMTADEWMTEEFVNFETEIQFEETDSKTGTLVLQKDNPSGLPENDAELRIPIRFR